MKYAGGDRESIGGERGYTIRNDYTSKRRSFAEIKTKQTMKTYFANGIKTAYATSNNNQRVIINNTRLNKNVQKTLRRGGGNKY